MEDAKEEIRERLAIEDVIGQYIELKRAGRNFKGHSPWGTDRTPSFMVSPDKGIWHDFSSNKGGDIFSFVMEMEGCTFREAVERLAQQAGVELKRYNGDNQKQAQHKQRLYEALELATKYYQFCLSKNQTVMQYVFYKRNLNKKTVENFRIGYAPKSGRALVDFLTKRGFSKKEMEDAGLLNRFGGDLFKGRMTIPLMDANGKIIGFTARIIEKDENSPKYLNTPETILYNKGRHIFGLSQAKDAIRRTDFVVVVEGNMDVISSHQAGVCQAVATAGTAMTEMHLKSFARMTKDIRLAYDGDEAGIRAAERAISMASKFGIYLSVIDDYHGCKDADELIQKDPELWKQATESYRPALEWLLEKYETKYNLKTEKGFREYCDEAKRLIEQIDSSETVLRERYERIVSERLGISLEAFRAKKVAQPEQKKLKPAKGVVKNTTVENRAEKNLAALIVCGKVAIDEFDVSSFNEAELSLIFEERYGGWSVGDLTKEANNLLKRVKVDNLERERRDLEAQIKVAEESGNSELEDELLMKLAKLIKS